MTPKPASQPTRSFYGKQEVLCGGGASLPPVGKWLSWTDNPKTRCYTAGHVWESRHHKTTNGNPILCGALLRLSTRKNDFGRATTMSTVTCSSGQARCSKRLVTRSAELCQCEDHVVKNCVHFLRCSSRRWKVLTSPGSRRKFFESRLGSSAPKQWLLQTRKTTSRIRMAGEVTAGTDSQEKQRNEIWEIRTAARWLL